MKIKFYAILLGVFFIPTKARAAASADDLAKFSGSYRCVEGCPLSYQQELKVYFIQSSRTIQMNWVYNRKEIPAFLNGALDAVDLGAQLGEDNDQYKTYFQNRSSKVLNRVIVKSETRACTPQDECDNWRPLERVELKGKMLHFTGYGALYQRVD
jgi:hypothetical protein